jgi:two-component system response regulator QseB
VNVLLVENEQLMAALRRAGYGASVASPAEARTMATAGLFDAIVLGGAHPDATSLSLCSALRQSAACTPILMLVARDEAETRIRGLEAGADDCVSLSCPADELLARLRALVRRADRS